MNRSDAMALMKEYTQNPSLVKHMLAVEAAMRGYARKLGEDEERWGIVGLLHDFDYGPNGITDLTASSVKKKMKSKGFARNVKREDIDRGAADFGVDLTEHIQFIIDAMKPIAAELELLKGAGEASDS